MSKKKGNKVGMAIIGICVGIFLLVMSTPILILGLFLPSLEITMVEEYRHIASVANIEWSDMIIYDTVRYENDFELANVSDTAFEFLVVNYTKQEQRERCVATDEEGNCIETEIYWVVVEEKVLEGKEAILGQLKKLGYNTSTWTVVEAINTLESINDGEEYIITYSNKDIEDMLEYFDEEQREWANMLIADNFIHEMFGETYDLPEYLPVIDGTTFAWPTPTLSKVTSHFGWRTDPINGKRTFHYGMDMAGAGALGQPIISIADGVVVQVTYGNNISGNNVRIEHIDSEGNVWQSRYSHMSQIEVTQGETVLQGKVIGAVGNTGKSTGPHLHLELKFNGQLVDPYPYIR